MGAVTYPNEEVQREIHAHFVPVRFDVIQAPPVMDRFNASWTPTIIVEDPNGHEHRRSQGYLDPRRFLGEMALARLKDALDRRDWKEALERAKEARERTRGDRAREPEALYWSAVARYKSSDDATGLTDGWNQLLDAFPDSEWAKRAEFIRRR